MFPSVKSLFGGQKAGTQSGRPQRFRPAVEALEERRVLSTYYVAPTGSNANPGTLAQPFKTIQHGIDMAAKPGDTIEVRAGTYAERLICSHSGNAAGGFITLENFPGEHVLLTGQGAANNDIGYGNNMVMILNQSYLKLTGFEIAYDNGIAVQDDAFGVRVQGSGSNVVIQGNTIHDITGSVAPQQGGAGIHVYGSSLTTPYDSVIIDGNTIYKCQPGDSQTETLTVNGNVTNFRITNNLIHDDNNIGIDMIGGEGPTFGLPTGTQGLPVARNGLCSHNTVYNIHANYGGGFAGGIYVDGGQNITISDNVSYQNDMGLEVGAENHGYVTSGVIVQDNLLYNNKQGGLVFGGPIDKNGPDPTGKTVGRVENCYFINNTVYNSDTSNTGQGALTIQWASNNVVANNIFVASANNILVNTGAYTGSNVNNTLDFNLYYAPGGPAKAQFNWGNQTYYWSNQNDPSVPDYRKATGEDAHSLFGNPLFANAIGADFHLTSASPAINSGSSAAGWYAATDFAGVTRDLPPDIGAFEYEGGGFSPVAQVIDRLGGAAAPSHSSADSAKHFDTRALAELLFGPAGVHRKAAFASVDFGETEC
jgi:hypothetical protein